jgi:hypothetical protein
MRIAAAILWATSTKMELLMNGHWIDTFRSNPKRSPRKFKLSASLRRAPTQPLFF